MLRSVNVTGQSARRSKLLASLLTHAILIVGGLVFIIPFMWMILTSFKSLTESMQVPPVIIPALLRWSNYTSALTTLPFMQFYANTIMMTVGRTAGQLIFCSLAAYAFARIEFPGRNVLFILTLSVLMIPSYVFLLPQYMIMKDLGWLNSIQALIVPGLFSSFGTFLLRQYFMSLPPELDEAAKIDGANHLQIFWHIVLPLVKPALIALSIFTVLWSWNDLMWPLVVNNSSDKMTLSVGLATLQGEYFTNFPVLMAGAVLATWPMLVMFICLQKYFVEGIALTGSKG